MKISAFVLLAVFVTGCSAWPAEKRLLSKHAYVRSTTLKSVRQWDDATRARVIQAMLAALSADDNRITNRATEALVSIGAPAVDALVAHLSSEDPFIRTLSVAILGDIGSPSQTIGPALVSALSDPHPLVREEAAHSLGKLGPAGTGGTFALIQALKDKDPEVRMAAEDALNRIGVKTPKTS